MSRVNRPSLPSRLVIHAVLYVMALTMLVPFAWMVATSLKTRDRSIGAPPEGAQAVLKWALPAGGPRAWQWRNYTDAWHAARLGRFYLNSFGIAATVTVLSLLHNALAGFAFAKLRFAGRRPASSRSSGTLPIACRM